VKCWGHEGGALPPLPTPVHGVWVTLPFLYQFRLKAPPDVNSLQDEFTNKRRKNSSRIARLELKKEIVKRQMIKKGENRNLNFVMSARKYFFFHFQNNNI
jgi:hypothetical protein